MRVSTSGKDRKIGLSIRIVLAVAAVTAVSLVVTDAAQADCSDSSTGLNASCYDPDAYTQWWDYPAGSAGSVSLEARWYSYITETWEFFDSDGDWANGSSGTVTAEFDGPCSVGGYNANFRFISVHMKRGPTWDWVVCKTTQKYKYCSCGG